MGPRRGMDGFARPAGAPVPPPTPGQRPAQRQTPRPAQYPPQRQVQQRPAPQPLPQRRPAPTQPVRGQRPTGRPLGPQDYARAAQEQEQLVPPKGKRARKPKRQGSGAWKVVLQFVIGLLVIAGVAAAIVALYIKYYQ